MAAINASNRWFLAVGAESEVLAGANGWAGTIDQRTDSLAPTALMNRKAFKLLKVLFSNPEDIGRLRINCMAGADSGYRAANAVILAGSGLPVVRSGRVASNCSLNACGVRTGNTGRLIIAVRHSSPSRSLKRIAIPRTVSGASVAYGCPPDREKRPMTGVRPGWKMEALESATPWPLLSKWPLTQTPLA